MNKSEPVPTDGTGFFICMIVASWVVRTTLCNLPNPNRNLRLSETVCKVLETSDQNKKTLPEW